MNTAIRFTPFALLICFSAWATAGDIERPPINYSSAAADNALSHLQDRLAKTPSLLRFEEPNGYLRSLLRELNVPISSQVLVFTKTSLQRHKIAPKTPRALYFNDDVYVGCCQHGDVLEVSAVDPKLGTVFYTLDQRQPEKAVFTRQNDACMLCHGSSQNQGFPGHLVRSVYPDAGGYPMLASGTFRIDQTSPLAQRWGGWYVSGVSGKQSHLGNLILKENRPPEEVDNSAGLNVTDLSRYFKPGNYLSPHSDIVALMVMEHQTEMHNLLTRANFLTKFALYEEAELNREFGRGDNYRSDSTVSRIKNAGEPLVKYMLFSGEAKLTDEIKGTTTFAKEFAERGPRDAQGRSLRELDLHHRLFKYPCSYLIYSAAFEQLPSDVKGYILHRLFDVLTSKDNSADFSHLTSADRQAILEILLATKPTLPNYWISSR